MSELRKNIVNYGITLMKTKASESERDINEMRIAELRKFLSPIKK